MSANTNDMSEQPSRLEFGSLSATESAGSSWCAQPNATAVLVPKKTRCSKTHAFVMFAKDDDSSPNQKFCRITEKNEYDVLCYF